jgi:hypothetical protein
VIKKIIEKIKYELKFNNPSYYTRISDKFNKKTYQRILQKKIGKLPPVILQSDNAQLTLAILANKKNFYESIAALYSFCFWNRNVYVHYHEDGTLTKNEFEILKKIFPGITIFIRSEQNHKVGDCLLLKGLAHCARLRSHFLFAVRSFDMIIEKKTPYLLQIDSDVLFFSKPKEILDTVKKGDLNGCYNRDVLSMYSFDDATIAKYLPVPVIPNFNAGIFLHNFDESFFDFVEAIMAKEPQADNSWHLEQTLFAMYATLKEKFLELPKTYALGRGARVIGNEVISKHYVHNTGYDFHKDFIYKLYPMVNSPTKTNL